MANMVTDHLAEGLFNNNNHLKCRQCGGSIMDSYAFNVHPDVKFHPNCLKCSECGCFFQDETSCYIKNEMPYCKDDYQRLFAEHCPKCEMPLNTNDMVQKVKNVIFHQECFSCSLCARPFSSGDEFLLIDLRLFCRQCHEQDLDHHAVRSGDSPGHRHMSVVRISYLDQMRERYVRFLYPTKELTQYLTPLIKSISVSRVGSSQQTKNN